MNNISRTDWERVDRMTDEEIDTSDIPPLDDSFFSKAQWRDPQHPFRVNVLIDPITMAWFKSRGNMADKEMATALREYAKSHNDT